MFLSMTPPLYWVGFGLSFPSRLRRLLQGFPRGTRCTVYVGLEKIIGNLSDVEESLMKMELFLIMKTEGVQLSDMVVQHSAYSEELRGVGLLYQNLDGCKCETINNQKRKQCKTTKHKYFLQTNDQVGFDILDQLI
uniref:Uncharacterized protein n=1 Tax=Lactuca sativa TaxID=4236 RepID=A0A9R1WFN1_LACSA|nr:hypothetical protein LSAT_V11C200068350 [Lactuca sativa]